MCTIIIVLGLLSCGDVICLFGELLSYPDFLNCSMSQYMLKSVLCLHEWCTDRRTTIRNYHYVLDCSHFSVHFWVGLTHRINLYLYSLSLSICLKPTVDACCGMYVVVFRILLIFIRPIHRSLSLPLGQDP